MSQNHDSVPLATGWVSSPEGRGTIDIVWSSFLTIFLCTWTAVCLNIPHPDAGKLRRLCTKVQWMAWAIIGPELVLAVAIGQFPSARRSVKRFHGLGHKAWTTRHGFFADMGGILLQPKNSTPFLVNSRQLAYLVEKGYGISSNRRGRYLGQVKSGHARTHPHLAPSLLAGHTTARSRDPTSLDFDVGTLGRYHSALHTRHILLLVAQTERCPERYRPGH